MEPCCTIAGHHPKSSRFQCFRAGETVSWNMDNNHLFGTVCWTGFAGDKICSFVNFETPLPVPLKLSPSLEDLRDQFVSSESSSSPQLHQHSHLIPVEELSLVSPKRPLQPSHTKLIQSLKNLSKRMIHPTLKKGEGTSKKLTNSGGP